MQDSWLRKKADEIQSFADRKDMEKFFIKIPFINKGIEFIDLPSIFRDNNVISAVPSYFENTESPIICYKYNKPIRNTILNFNKLVSDLDIETSSPDS